MYEAIGNIDEKYIEEADAKKYNKTVRVGVFAPWLKWAMPIVACLVVAVAIFGLPNMFINSPPTDSSFSDPSRQYPNPSDYTPTLPPGIQSPDPGIERIEVVPPSFSIGKPTLRIEEEPNIADSYAHPDDWRGLPTENFVLQEQADANRIVFYTIQDLADYADAFIIVPSVRQAEQDGENMQTAIAEYAETIGDAIHTHQWDDYTISTGSRILIRQTLIAGCSMDMPSNLLRIGGVYLLPVRFSSYLGAYEVVGDLDVLFELDDRGAIISHSRFPELNKYDGKAFSELLDDVRAIYPKPETRFSEQPINSLEQAEVQINTAYLESGYRKFTIAFENESIIKGTDVYLFKVTFFGLDGSIGSEYGAIAKINGAFIRGEITDDGDIHIYGGLGGFPKNSQQ